MRTMRATGGIVLGAAFLLGLLVNRAEAKKCHADSVQVGRVCVDRYEASVWEIASADTKLIRKVQHSKVHSAADMAGATQRGATADDYGAACPHDGGGCTTVYAVSVPGVTPSAWVTWFQAAAACANSGKRLLSNQEWTVAALGTPDPGTDNGTTDCNVGSTFAVANTGTRSACVSDRGAFDMVGNLDEWVADWVPLATACPGWGAFADDQMCVGGASTIGGPGALLRGGRYGGGALDGPLGVDARYPASAFLGSVGFRCGRDL